MMSFPSSPSTESEPALEQITSSLVVPVSVSSAAVPVIVHSVLAPATLERRPCANAGPTIRPKVATDTNRLPSPTEPALGSGKQASEPTPRRKSYRESGLRCKAVRRPRLRASTRRISSETGCCLLRSRPRMRVGCTCGRRVRPRGKLNTKVFRLFVTFPFLVAAFVTVAPRTADASTELSAASVALATLHTCALTDAGGVECWGDDSQGELGDGNFSMRTIPVGVSGLDTGVAEIDTGGAGHSCAVTDAGAALCWGRNRWGQLGDGTHTNSNVPVAVTGLDSGVVSISTGGDNTCALIDAGAMECWGRNESGQLGN